MNWSRLSQVLALSAAAIGVISFSGWVLGIPILTRLHPAWVTMKANTALCLILCGWAIFLLSGPVPSGARRRIAQLFAVVAGGVAAFTLGEHLGWFPPILDELLFRETVESAGRSFPGRMNPASAINFVLLSAGILSLDVQTRGGRAPAEFCAVLVVWLTELIFLTYFYQVELPPAVAKYVSIALHTVLAFLLLATGLLFARPDRGIMTVISAGNVGGVIARRLMPAVLLVPALLGWLAVSGRNAGLYGRGVGTVLVVALLTLIFSGVVWWAARAVANAESRRRAAEAARAQVAAIVDSSEDAIVSKNLEGRVISWNAGAEKILGFTAAEMIGQPILRVIPPDRQNEETEILSKIGRGEAIAHFETIRMTKDGRRIDVSLTISPVRDDRGKVVGASKIMRNITQRKRDAENLRQARDEAEAASRAKDDFLAVLSHELRTPLTPALAAASALENSPPETLEELRENLAIIRRNIELEARLVDDLLDTTRISSGKLRIHATPVPLRECLRDALVIAEPAMREKGIALLVDLQEADPLVRADAARLTQVFSNLLTNAAKFTPSGGKVTVRDASGENDVRVIISDNGMGITSEVLPQIFAPFRQGEPEMTNRFGGLGLGLSVAKALVEAHGGTITAESAGRDRGATFTVTLPTLAPSTTRPETSAAPATSPHGKARSLRVLLVEDHPDTSAVLSRLMTRWGHIVTTANSVAQTRAILTESNFDLLLSDLGLPDGTGVEVITAVHAKAKIPAVVMSGFGMEADLARTEAAGFRQHLVKPVSAEQLRELLDRFSRQ